jgi:hypothetical protein
MWTVPVPAPGSAPGGGGCRGALFDVYLGEKPISSDGKKTVIARLPGILGG